MARMPRVWIGGRDAEAVLIRGGTLRRWGGGEGVREDVDAIGEINVESGIMGGVEGTLTVGEVRLETAVRLDDEVRMGEAGE
jgi:hypothetical protein